MEDKILELLLSQSKRLDSIQAGLDYHIKRTDLLEDHVNIMTSQVDYFEDTTFLFMAVVGLVFSLAQLAPYIAQKK